MAGRSSRTSSGSRNGDGTINSSDIDPLTNLDADSPTNSDADIPPRPPASLLTYRVHPVAVEWTDGPMDQDAIEAIISNTHEFTRQHDLVLLFFTRDSIAGEEHILSALFHALRAEAEERSRTRDPALDILRFIAGERQIRSAIRSAGLRPGLSEYLCLLFIPTEGRSDGEGQPEIGVDVIRDSAFAFLRGIGFEISVSPDQPIGTRNDLLAALERTALVDMKL